MELKCVLEGLGFRKTDEDGRYEYWHYRLAPKGTEIAVPKPDLDDLVLRENGLLNTIGIHIWAVGKAEERRRIRKLI